MAAESSIFQLAQKHNFAREQYAEWSKSEPEYGTRVRGPWEATDRVLSGLICDLEERIASFSASTVQEVILKARALELKTGGIFGSLGHADSEEMYFLVRNLEKIGGVDSPPVNGETDLLFGFKDVPLALAA